MSALEDVTAAAQSYGQVQYDQGKAAQRAADQPALDALTAQVADMKAHDLLDEQRIADLERQLAGLSQRFPGDPGVGRCYVGESRNGGDPADREKTWGAVVGVFRSYFVWGQWDAIVQRAQRDLAAGRLPWISVHTGGDGWGPMAAGVHDVEVKALLARLAALPGPVWLTWDHEPLDNPEKGTPAQFCAMNRRTVGMLPLNVALVPIVQTYPLDPTQMKAGAGSFAPWFEPGSYTFVGIDTYNHRWYVKYGIGQAKDKAPGGTYRDAATVLSVVDKLRADLGKPDVPVGIAETGIRTDPAAPGKAAGDLKALAAQAPGKGVVAVSYFDSDQNSPEGSWALDWTGDGTNGQERVTAYGPLVAAGAHLH